jgi:predicted DNA-binding transcriptional regulator YafY
MRERLHIDATGWNRTGEDLSMLAVVQDAVARERKLAFDYTKADGEKAPRTVDPLGLVAKGLSWYLVARGANGVRTYRVSRMEAVTMLASGFERPPRFDLAEFWRKSTAEFSQQRRRYAATLALTADAARKLRGWSVTTELSGGKHHEDSGDRTTLRVEFEAESEARFIVLGFGSSVEVVEPQELRQWVQAEVRSMAGRKISHSAKD